MCTRFLNSLEYLKYNITCCCLMKSEKEFNKCINNGQVSDIFNLIDSHLEREGGDINHFIKKSVIEVDKKENVTFKWNTDILTKILKCNKMTNSKKIEIIEKLITDYGLDIKEYEYIHMFGDEYIHGNIFALLLFNNIYNIKLYKYFIGKGANINKLYYHINYMYNRKVHATVMEYLLLYERSEKMNLINFLESNGALTVYQITEKYNDSINV